MPSRAKKPPRKAGVAGVAVDGEAVGGDCVEEGVDVDEGGVGGLGLGGDDLIEGCDLGLDGDDLGGGEEAGVRDGSLLLAGEDEGNLGGTGGVDEVAGDDAENLAECGGGKAGFGGDFAEDQGGGGEVGDFGDVGDVGDDQVGGAMW